MPPPAYTVLLARGGLVAPVTSVIYTAPSTGRIVVRTIAIVTYALGPSTWSIGVPSVADLCAGTSLGLNSTSINEGRWVLEPGDELQGIVSGGDISYYISGYSFTS